MFKGSCSTLLNRTSSVLSVILCHICPKNSLSTGYERDGFVLYKESKEGQQHGENPEATSARYVDAPGMKINGYLGAEFNDPEIQGAYKDVRSGVTLRYEYNLGQNLKKNKELKIT